MKVKFSNYHTKQPLFPQSTMFLLHHRDVSAPATLVSVSLIHTHTYAPTISLLPSSPFQSNKYPFILSHGSHSEQQDSRAMSWIAGYCGSWAPLCHISQDGAEGSACPVSMGLDSEVFSSTHIPLALDTWPHL